MPTKQILFTALLLGTISTTGLAMEADNFKEDFRSKHTMQEEIQKNPTLYYTTNPNREFTCVISEDYIIFIETFKKQPDGSCSSSGPQTLDDINNALILRSELPMATKEFLSADKIGHLTSSNRYCNTSFIIERRKKNADEQKENSNNLHELLEKKDVILNALERGKSLQQTQQAQ